MNKRNRRLLLSEQQGWRCWWCGEEMQFERYARIGIPAMDMATIEHLIPASKGGSGGLTNTVAAHAQCNHERGRNNNWQPHESMWRTRRMRELFRAAGMENELNDIVEAPERGASAFYVDEMGKPPRGTMARAIIDGTFRR